MALTQNFTKSFDSIVMTRAKASKEFRCGILNSAINELTSGDHKVANILLNHYLSALHGIHDRNDEVKHYSARLQSLLKIQNHSSMQSLLNLLREMQRIEGA